MVATPFFLGRGVAGTAPNNSETPEPSNWLAELEAAIELAGRFLAVPAAEATEAAEAVEAIVVVDAVAALGLVKEARLVSRSSRSSCNSSFWIRPEQ